MRGYLEGFIRKSNSSLVMELSSSSLEELLLAQEVANKYRCIDVCGTSGEADSGGIY